MSIKTVFSIDNEYYSVEGTGQEAASTIIGSTNGIPKRIFLIGFMINGQFVKVNL